MQHKAITFENILLCFYDKDKKNPTDIRDIVPVSYPSVNKAKREPW